MRKLILSTGLLMTALSALVFAEPDAQGGATTGESSPIVEQRAKVAADRKARQLLERIAEDEATHSADAMTLRAKVAAGANARWLREWIAEDEATHSADDVIGRAKVAAGPNANARLSLDLIPNGGAGNQRNDRVTSGTVSGRGTTIAIEVFATGVTTSLTGMQLRFDFDASLLTFVKAENRAFAFNLPHPTGTDFAATSPVRLASSGFLTRAEFTTATDVAGREFSIGLGLVTLSESLSSSDTLTTTSRISFNVPTTSTPDFDGDGMVGFSDFLAFAGRYGAQRGDSRYQAKYDLNSDGAIDFQDFLSFAGSYGSPVPPPPPPGGSSSPDLIVESPSVSDSTLTPGQSFTLRATVRNRGTARSASTTLRYYRSSNATISTSDTEVGTDSVSGLSASRTGSESISLTAPSSTGTYYYGACVASVSGESNTNNNCSAGVRVTVSGGGGGGSGSGTPKMYWIDFVTSKIQRANLDGSNVEDLITTGLTTPYDIALDVGRGKMYWTNVDIDGRTDKIQRANLDGSNVEDLITTGLIGPLGIALDVGRGKMYWTNVDFDGGGRTSKIQRANLDGSNVEDLITTGLSGPFGIALDVGRGKMYWTDINTEKIQRANLDGSQVEDLITTGALGPYGIALDVGRGKMYWTRKYPNDPPKIQRANLDGSNVEDLITTVPATGALGPEGIALDVGRGKMYWTDINTAKIQRANLDGSQVEDLITTGVDGLSGIALDTQGTGSAGGGGGSSGGGGGGGSRPDLIVESPSVSDSTLTPGQSFTLRATVRNRGTARSASTTLRYYGSGNVGISTGDIEVGTDSVSGLSASGTSAESIILRAPSRAGTYYFGACVASVSGESNTNNNCSTGVRVTVSDDHSNTRSGATSLSLGGSRSGRIETGGDVDYFRVQVSSSGALTVYTTGNTDTYGTLQSSSGTTLETDDDDGSGTNFSIARSVSAGTYYIAVRGYSSSETGSYTVHASFQSGGSGGGGSGGGSDDHSNTRSGATSLSLGGSRSGRIETGSDVDYFRVQVSSSGTLTVYTTGNTDTYGTLQSSSGTTLETDDDDGSGRNFSIARSVSAGTYYIKVEEYGNNATGSYTVHASFQSGGSGGGSGSGSGRPDLIVESLSTSSSSGLSFTLNATVRNRGTARSAATTLRYYRSSNATISTSDTEVGTDSVSGLSASATSRESIRLTAPSRAGTYYYGACVASVSGESNTDNNCSDAVRITVSGGSGGGGGGSGGGGSGSGSLGACRVGMVVRPNQSCQISGGEFRNVGGGCFVYTPFGSGRFCLGRSFNLNGFRGTRVGNDYRIDGLP